MAESEEDRQRGILSKADREYLLGEKPDLSDQGERDTRYRIRNRIESAILDFDLLEGALDFHDIELVFSHLDDEDLSSVVRFVFLGLVNASDGLDQAKEHLEGIIEAALYPVYDFLDDEHILEEINVDISAERTRPDVEELKRKYTRGEETFEELRYLRESDEFEGNEKLLSARMLKHLYEGGALTDDIQDRLLEGTEYETLEEYFTAIDQQIAESGAE